jgi:beta-glucosidase
LIELANTSDGFWWMTGIEGSTVPHIGADEFEWIQHYDYWQEDLTMLRHELSANWIRIVFPWYKVNPALNSYDWDWMDRVIDKAAELGFQIALDPIHFGTPLWMEQGFGDPDFAQHAATYFGQIARRYGKIEAVTAFVPHNEPTITALFGGLFGEWPPYRRSPQDFNRLLVEISKGMVLARQAVQAEVNEPIFLYVDAVDQAATRQPHSSTRLQTEIENINLRRFLCYDLVSGKVDHTHPLTETLLADQVKAEDLTWLLKHGAELDILGINFYSHSEVWLDETVDGEIRHERGAHADPTIRLYQAGLSSFEVNRQAPRPAGLFDLMKDYWQRYQRPLVLTETNYYGTVGERQAWLGYTLDEITRLRLAGIPVLGYTWWGATDPLNWGQALKERNQIHPVGLWSLEPQTDGKMARIRTNLVDSFQSLVKAGMVATKTF